MYTEDVCVNGTRGETGCFRAHKDAWLRCSRQEDAERCLVLERVWTYGDQDHADKKEIQNLPTNHDYYLVGNCGYAWCTHAYSISKAHAKEL